MEFNVLAMSLRVQSNTLPYSRLSPVSHASTADPSSGTASNLWREVIPRTTSTLDLGQESALATSATTALVALPPSGGAVTLTCTSVLPASSVLSPKIASRPERGVTCTARLVAIAQVKLMIG